MGSGDFVGWVGERQHGREESGAKDIIVTRRNVLKMRSAEECAIFFLAHLCPTKLDDVLEVDACDSGGL